VIYERAAIAEKPPVVTIKRFELWKAREGRKDGQFKLEETK
jgi:hypothetical protein